MMVFVFLQQNELFDIYECQTCGNIVRAPRGYYPLNCQKCVTKKQTIKVTI